MADELQSVLSKYLVVGWEDRDSAKARLRNLVRVAMRKFGYPLSARDEVAKKIIGAMVVEEAQKAASAAPAKKKEVMKKTTKKWK